MSGSTRSRTEDLLRAKQALYQLSYAPIGSEEMGFEPTEGNPSLS